MIPPLRAGWNAPALRSGVSLGVSGAAKQDQPPGSHMMALPGDPGDYAHADQEGGC